MSKGTEIRRDSAGNVVGITKVSDEGSTRVSQTNPGSKYTEHSNGSVWKTGSDGRATQIEGPREGNSK